MKCDVAVTFEYATRAPETARIQAVEASGPQTIASRALREARKQIRPVNWTSIVVLLQRLDSGSEVEEADDAVEPTDGEA